MSWTLLIGLILGLGLALLATLSRRKELALMRESVREREWSAEQGVEARLQHPVIDLSRCLGCATCVAVCPESDVLDIVHGQAMVVNGARCEGVAACERECPVGAITVTIANLDERTDVPALTPALEAVGQRGLFLAGEVTAHALIKTAIDQGTAVGAEVARRVHEPATAEDEARMAEALDLCIVGAGPAGLACSLEAKRNGLSFVTLDQEESLGGTVAKYPRRKLVMTQPVDLPVYGRFKRTSYTKEELVELWQGIAAEQALPIHGGQVFEGLERDASGNYVVRTQTHVFTARNVCLALGRRGSPRQLGVPGEDLPKVASGLLDAQSYRDQRILVVGGGDSAVEAALGLAEQPGNEVVLSYRRERLFRVRKRNHERLAAALAEGRLRVLYRSQILAIHPDSVELAITRIRGSEAVTLANDHVFVMAGGVAPFELLNRSGVSFDPSQRTASAPVLEQGTGLAKALALGLTMALLTLAFAYWQRDYYLALPAERPAQLKHGWLRPGRGFGLAMGITAVALIFVNLLYLVRRSPRSEFNWGSLQRWMTSHIATGIFALLCAMLHGAMTPRDTVGGHAFWALAALLLTGAIGRYFYAYVPRAANGRELELEEVKVRLGQVSQAWEQGERTFSERVRREISALIESEQWEASFVGRVRALVRGEGKLHRLLLRLAKVGRGQEVPEKHVRDTLQLARSAHRSALMAAHYEDVRAILGTWRYLHRWVALLMVLLVIVHVIYALAYGESSPGVGR